MSDEILKLQMKLTVLRRKKMVMDSWVTFFSLVSQWLSVNIDQFESEQKEITQYKRNIKKLQKDIEKISSLVASQNNAQAKLEEKNFGLEQEIRSRLKDGELENLSLSEAVERTQAEREKALEGLIEAEYVL